VCDICEAMGQEVLEDGTIVRTGPGKGAEAVLEAFLRSAGPGVASHPGDCDCRLCWNVRLKRQGLGVVRSEKPRRRKGHRRR
jgi:hypothetical protein